MKNLIIAIDEKARAGKSTISKIISKKLNINYIDTGAMYRALTYKALENNIDIYDEDKIIDLLDNTNIEFRNNELYLDNKIIKRRN